MTEFCPHRQAAQVALYPTGEVVATICISCHRQLPPHYIRQQREQAERVARCNHAWIELAELGVQPEDWNAICAGCGVLRSEWSCHSE